MSPELLPQIPVLRRVTQSLAMLDAILSPEWEYRYFSFNSTWGPGEEMASMRNGSGDDWFLLLDCNGAALKGFAHELAEDALVSQAIQAQLPREFSSFLAEPAFAMQQATFCYWRRADDLSWNKVHSTLADDGSTYMLGLLLSGPAGYKDWAEGYFEVPANLEAVSAIFAHRPLDDLAIIALNPDSDLGYTYAQAMEIGYPCVLAQEHY